MKPGKRTFTLALGTLAFLAVFAWLLTTRGPLAPVGVELATVERGELSPDIYGIGTVEARHAYAVGPIQAGRLLRVWVDQGDRVRAGQLLAEIDPVDLRQRSDAAASAVARARQAALAAQAQIAEAESRAQLAAANSTRYQSLVKQQFIAQEMADSRHHEASAAQAALVAARANAAGAQREISRAEAERQGIDQLRSSLSLLSPIDGIITAREAEPGTTVVAGQPVLRLVDPAQLWVRARVDQARAQGLQVGQAADIVLRSAPATRLPGKVARIELQSDTITEERVLNVAFDPAPAQLYLGELAEISIHQTGERDVLNVPRAAIAQHNQQTGVWQMVNGRARFKPVQLGMQSATRSQIVGGLDAGETLIVYSAKQLENDVRVREQTLSQP